MTYRLMFKFWIDIDKPDEEGIADLIEYLKTNRLFAKTIRNGIRLICDLRDGNTDVLLELFPHLRLQGLQETRDRVGGDEFARLEKAVLNLADKVDTQGMKPISTSNGINQIGGMKQLAAPVYDDDDDDLLTIEKDTSSSKDVSANFIRSLMALQQ